VKSANLQRFATGVDLLVHEALARQLVAVMNQAGVKCLPVIEGDSIIGVVTTSDVIRVLATMKHLADGSSVD